MANVVEPTLTEDLVQTLRKVYCYDSNDRFRKTSSNVSAISWVCSE